MLTDERKNFILRQLAEKEIIKSQELVSILNASESTIRRDLKELEEDGFLERIHGGAKKRNTLSYEQDMNEKSSKNISEKQKVAQYAASLIKKSEVIYLDAGTTTYEMIPYLEGKKISVVTNSIYHASALADLNIPTIVIGGSIKMSTKAILGSFSMKQLEQFRFNRAFLGVNGIHSVFGFTTPDPEEAAMKETAMCQSEVSYFLGDHTKFNTVSFTKIASIEKASILTDYCPMESLKLIKKRTKIKEVVK
ncbi:DeoR/GlpR family DNA-binding transcription regulator [Vagococcus entomophilus]|uniref:DeoR family transcriptional regulator n=1 Tax=Vagococcus entomophilus TaxID=1160095 RepID=A0A430AJQ2_9ENTE|nr:DeoR/GlpR family DNA-binding transcription regulator [Vagococcus entomophilus]RSU08288.1 DeoR family transcriptional regulator [Vagococcus entomophilus]